MLLEGRSISLSLLYLLPGSHLVTGNIMVERINKISALLTPHRSLCFGSLCFMSLVDAVAQGRVEFKQNPGFPYKCSHLLSS